MGLRSCGERAAEKEAGRSARLLKLVAERTLFPSPFAASAGFRRRPQMGTWGAARRCAAEKSGRRCVAHGEGDRNERRGQQSFSSGQSHGEAGASRLAFDFDMAAKTFDQIAGDVEAETGAFALGLGREEGLE